MLKNKTQRKRVTQELALLVKEKDIPPGMLARTLGVTRANLWNWLRGDYLPHPRMIGRINDLVIRLKQGELILDRPGLIPNDIWLDKVLYQKLRPSLSEEQQEYLNKNHGLYSVWQRRLYKLAAQLIGSKMGLESFRQRRNGGAGDY